MYLEDVVYFSILAFLVIMTVMIQVWSFRKGKALNGIFAQAVLYGSAVLWWFMFASDGLSQVIGASLYGGVFVISLFIYTMILFVKKKKVA